MSDSFLLAGYLKRIGVAGPARPDLETLVAIHAAHVDAIPFESLDPFLGRPVSLDLADLQEKLLANQRGGYCFEQNTLLKAALEAIGFSVTGLIGRVRWMAAPGSPLGPRSHMVLRVDLPEGSFLADVGFGGFLLDRPLPLKTDIEHATAMGTFLLTQAEGMFTLGVKQPAGWRTAYLFTLDPQLASDYEVANWYSSTNPEARFVSTLIMERLTRDRRYKLADNRLIVQARDGEPVEDRLIGSAEELGQILEQTFRISLPAPAYDIFARLGQPGHHHGTVRPR